MRAEAERDEGRAVRKLVVGARTSPELAAEVRRVIDRAIPFATAEMQAFLGIEVLAHNGREIDLDRLAATIAVAVQLVNSFKP